MKDNLYVVYHVSHNGVVVYIGYGNQHRPKHATSGTSNNYQLNRLHHTGEILETEIVFTTTSKTEAVEREKADILRLLPIYNSVYISTGRQDAAIVAIKARKKLTKFIASLKRHEKTYSAVSSIFNNLNSAYGITQLMIGINIDGFTEPPFKQFKRYIRGEPPSDWYITLMESGLIEAKKVGKHYFVKLLL